MRYNIDLSSWRLSLADGIVRMPVRNKAMRAASFEDRYDSLTVFYDIFWNADYKTVTCIAAPLLNLAEDLPFKVVALPSGQCCEVSSEELPHLQLLTIAPPAGTVALSFESVLGSIVRAIQPNLNRAFSGARAIYTLQKDNDLQWIRDWATFYSHEHGANAVILYDNSSTRYDIYEIANVLESIEGIEQVAVVDWSYPYGAFDLRDPLSLHCSDGIYCQWAAFHHVRWRLAGDAMGLLNADIDEFVVKTGKRTIFEAVETAASAYIRFWGYWVESVRQTTNNDIACRRHSDYRYLASDPVVSETKWIIAPQRLSNEAFLCVHTVVNAYPSVATDFTLYSFKSINTFWDSDRLGHKPRRQELEFDASYHKLDPALSLALDRVFGGNITHRDARHRPSPSTKMAAHVARLRSGLALRTEQPIQAQWWAREAVTLNPTIPSYREHLAHLLDSPEESKEQNDQAMALREGDYGFHYQRGLYAMHNLAFEEAIKEFQQSRVLDPSQPATLESLLLCYAEINDFESVERLAPEVVRLCGYSRGSLQLLMAPAKATGSWEMLHKLASKAVEQSPENPIVLEWYADILVQQRLFVCAKEMLARARNSLTATWTRDDLARVNRESPCGQRHGRTEGVLHAKEARIAFNEGRIDEAADLMKHASLLLYPNLHYEMQTADFFDHAGNSNESLAALRRAELIARTPALSKSTQESVRGGDATKKWLHSVRPSHVRALIRLGDHLSARELLDEARADPDLFLRTGTLASRAWMSAGLLKDAEATARAVLEIFPGKPEVLILLARILMKSGDLPGAYTAAEAVVQTESKDASQAHRMLARIEESRNNYNKAAGHLEGILGLNPYDRAAARGLVRNLLRAGQELEALQWARTNLARYRDDTDTIIDLAQALLASNQIDEAVTTLRDAAEAAPNEVRLATWLLRCLNRGGEHREAADVAASIVEIAPHNAMAYQELAVALQMLKERRQAIKAWQTFLALKPEASARVNVTIAHLALAEGDSNLATAAAQEAMRQGAAFHQEFRQHSMRP